jgi:lipoate-protein ligase B
VERVRAEREELAYLVLVEHDPPVITLGRGKGPRHVLATDEELARLGIEVHPSTRGGDVTYHGPGQLVGYPICRLDRRGRDVHRYLRNLEEVLIGVLGRFGVEAGRQEGLTGVWTDQGKIAAIGIAVRRWVSYHGFALNVSPDLSHFETIIPCGLDDRAVTSLSAVLGRQVALDEVKAPLLECMVEVLGFERARAGAIEECDGAGR